MAKLRKGDALYGDNGKLIGFALTSEPEYLDKYRVNINKILNGEYTSNPYTSPEGVEESIYDPSAPDGYYTILGGTAAFMLAIGFCIGVVTTVVFI